MLAVVVDDHDMGVTHVIRGDDHLNNAFRQLVLIRAMGWEEPTYAHVPLIHGADGAKLSKRHGALGVDAYRDEFGYLPEAVNNYLLRLGWGHGDEEIITQDQAIKWFDVDQVGRSPSRFDFKKLENLNGHYMREADDDRLAALVAKRLGGTVDLALIARAMPVLKPRAANLIDLAEGAKFLIERAPISLDEKAKSLLEGDAIVLLGRAHEALSRLSDWEMTTLEESVRVVAQEADVGLGKVAQPLRAALTGRGTSPGIFDVLMLLGREESLDRIGNIIDA
jgi:glutamyl-tRNA synthetase